MQINSVSGYKSNSIIFSANLILKQTLNYKNEPILKNEFVKYYADKVSKLGKQTDSVEINVITHPRSYGDYLMDVEVIRNSERHKKAQALLLCPNIIEALPKYLEDEYKWLTSWFKNKNGTEILNK